MALQIWSLVSGRPLGLGFSGLGQGLGFRVVEEASLQPEPYQLGRDIIAGLTT